MGAFRLRGYVQHGVLSIVDMQFLTMHEQYISTPIVPLILTFFNVDFMAPVTPEDHLDPKPIKDTMSTAMIFIRIGT